MSKASLYKLQNPHKTDKKLYKKQYFAFVGSREQSRKIVVFASSLNEAIEEARNYCHPSEHVVEVKSADLKKIWDAFDTH